LLLYIKVISSCAAVTWLLVLALGSATADEANRVDGKAVGGLRLRLELSAAEKGKKLQPHCNLILENVGDSDLNVKLGFSLANWEFHHPDAVRLFVRSKGNKTRTLIYSINVAGGLDPFVVSLPAGSSYTLRCAFDKYADSETGERIDLLGEDYWITAELLGEAITRTNQDVQGLALMPCWQGKVRSNDVQLPFANKQSDKGSASKGRFTGLWSGGFSGRTKTCITAGVSIRISA
jgi:hypothetical protein